MASTPWSKKVRLHESTQRELCRLVFVCLGLIPILLIAGYSIIRVTPWYQSYQKHCWQQRISDNLGGVNVRFSSIEFPSPNHFRAHDFVCENPETGQDILKVSQVQVVMVGNGWIVNLDSPELNGKEMQSAIQVIHDWFLCRPQKTATKLAINLSELAVYDGQRSTEFQNVVVTLQPTDISSTLSLKFAFANQKFAVPAALIVTRVHALEYPRTVWELNSNDVSIPCDLLTERFPMMRNLGDQASFRGKIQWSQNDQQWSGYVEKGKFSFVDLGATTAALGSPVRGLASVNIEQALIRNGTIGNLRGSVDLMPNQPASADTRWLQHTISTLKLIPSPELLRYQAKTTDIQNMSFDFDLGESGMVVRGKTKHLDIPQLIAARFANNMLLAGNDQSQTTLKDVKNWLNPNADANRDLSSFLIRVLPWSSMQTKVAARP